MDPDEALKRMRTLVFKTLRVRTKPSAEEVELAQQFEALDQWLSKGGFLPQGWNPK